MTYNFKQASFFPSRLSQYVKGMQYHSQISAGGVYIASLGTPANADTDGLIDGINVGADGLTITCNGLAVGASVSGGSGGVVGAIGVTADATYGRNVTLTGFTNPLSVTVYGWDYLGQYMAETIAAAATSGAGVKAFKRIEKLVLTDGGDTDCDVGWGNVLGLPFATSAILATMFDEVLEGTPATLVDVVRTDPQTLTTGDPRGTIDPNSNPDGAKEIVVVGIADNYVNASGNGGLHGIAHVFA